MNKFIWVAAPVIESGLCLHFSDFPWALVAIFSKQPQGRECSKKGETGRRIRNIELALLADFFVGVYVRRKPDEVLRSRLYPCYTGMKHHHVHPLNKINMNAVETSEYWTHWSGPFDRKVVFSLELKK